ncbi:MAG: hypothetical protein ACE5F2_01955 [Candidatus Paceibacteria bacterium]
MPYNLFIKPIGEIEWLDIGPVSDSYVDTKEGIIEELNSRQEEVARKVSEHFGIFFDYELKYFIGDTMPTD